MLTKNETVDFVQMIDDLNKDVFSNKLLFTHKDLIIFNKISIIDAYYNFVYFENESDYYKMFKLTIEIRTNIIKSFNRKKLQFNWQIDDSYLFLNMCLSEYGS